MQCILKGINLLCHMGALNLAPSFVLRNFSQAFATRNLGKPTSHDEMAERNLICGDLIAKCIRCHITAKETDLMPITRILLRVKLGQLAFIVATSFTSSRIIKKYTNKYFHVVHGHN